MTTTEELGIKVGDFFVSSWGYDQTNIDFYKVVGLTPKGVKLLKWQSARVGGGNFTQEAVIPGEWPRDGAEPFQKKVNSYGLEDNISIYVSLTSYSNARPWTGATEYETASGFGH